MKIYLAGTPGNQERESQWHSLLHSRLLSFWDIIQRQFSVYDAFILIKKRNENLLSRKRP